MKILNEDTFIDSVLDDMNLSKSQEKELKKDIQQADAQLGDDTLIVDAVNGDDGDIEQALNGALEANLEQLEYGGKNFVNVLLIGEAGTGKTSRVESWAKRHHINLLKKDAKGFDETDLNGIPYANKEGTAVTRLATTELDSLERPNSVLFLDEFNRAKKTVRGTFLSLINQHVVNDPRDPDGERFLPNFLFTVAAINPPATFGRSVDELDQAELSRFQQILVQFDPLNLLKYLTGMFDDFAKKAKTKQSVMKLEGRKALAKKLLTDPQFIFDSPDEAAELQSQQRPILNSRSFTLLLNRCDGTKENFLKLWDGFCNPDKKSMVERILSDYQDVDDKANSVFGDLDGEDIPDFLKGPSNWDKISGNIDDEF